MARTFTPQEQRLAIKVANEVHRVTTIIVNVIYGSIVDIADTMMKECTDEMQERGVVRYQLKHHIRQAQQRSRQLRNRFPDTHNSLYLDLLDEIGEECKNDITVLVYTVKSALDRINTPDSLHRAKIFATGLLWEIAETIFDTVCLCVRNEYAKRGYPIIPDIKGKLHHLSPTDTKRAWLNIANIYCDYSEQEATIIRDDKQLDIAIQAICNRLQDDDLYNRASTRALNLNKEAVDEYYSQHPEEVRLNCV